MACPGRRRGLVLIYKESMGASPKRGAPETAGRLLIRHGQPEAEESQCRGCPPEALRPAKDSTCPAFAIRHQDSSCGSAGWFEAGFRKRKRFRIRSPTCRPCLRLPPVSPPVSIPLPTTASRLSAAAPALLLSERLCAGCGETVAP